MKNDLSDNSDNEYKSELTMKSHDGISPDRIVNIETLRVIEDLLKCPICQNYSDCDFTASYCDLFIHEEKCNIQKVKCPNKLCKYGGKFPDFLKHQLICNFDNVQSGFSINIL